MPWVKQRCDRCDGQGFILYKRRYRMTCPRCNGSKVIKVWEEEKKGK